MLFFGNIYSQESFNLNISASTASNDGNYCGRVIFTVVNDNNFPIEIEIWQKTPGASTFTSPGTTTTINANGTIGINSSFATTAGSYSYYAVFTQIDGSILSNTSMTPISVIIYPRPVAGNITGASQVCVGLTNTLSSNATGGSGGYTISWLSSLTAKGIINSTGVLTGVESGTTNISYSVTDNKGCVSPSSALYPVSVNGLPTAPIANSISLEYNGLLQSTDITPTSGQSISWFTSSTGGLSSFKPQGTNVGIYNSYARAKIDATGCISSTRTFVSLTITQKPITISNIVVTKVYNGTPSISNIDIDKEVGGLISADGVIVIGNSTNFSNKIVANNYTSTVTFSLTTNPSTGKENNYYISGSNPILITNGSITKLPITLTASANTKVYDGTISATATPTITLGSLAIGDVGVYSETYDTKSQGTNKTLTPTGTILDASNALMTGNYSITYATNTNGVITAKQLTILDPTITKSKEYDKTITANVTAGTLSNILKAGSIEDAVTASAVGTYSTSTVGTNKIITVVYKLDGADKDNYIKPVDKVYTDGVITAKQLTISDPTITKSKEYDKTLTASTTAGTLSGVVTVGSVTDAVTASAVGTYSTSSAGTAKKITVVYTLAGADKDNYIKPVDKVYTDGVITTKPIVVKAIASDKLYDGNKNANVLLSSSNIFSVDDVKYPYTLAEFDTKDVGNNKTVTVTGISLAGVDAGNYSLTSTTVTTTANITGSTIPFAVPNAFSPNGDGKNDKFKIIFNNTTGVTLRLQIYNRNGTLMFNTNNISEGWDGRYKDIMQDMGIYFVKYRIEIAGGMTYEDTPRLYLFK